MTAVFNTVLGMSLSASVVIAVVMILRLLLKKAPRWICCLLWAVVAFRLVCPLTFELPVSGRLFNGSVADRIEDVSESIYEAAQLLETAEIAENTDAAQVFGEASDAAPGGAAIKAGAGIVSAIPAVWAAGSLIMLAYAAARYLSLRKSVSGAVDAGARLKVCDGLRSPFILGITDPVIYLPSGLDEAARQNMLLHENAHIKRLDNVWKPLAWLILAVHWFNPFVWAAFIMFCRDMELACDERAIKEMDAESIADYAQVLLNCGCGRRYVSVVPLEFSGIDLKERVKHVLNYKKPSVKLTVLAAAVCVVAGLGLLITPKATAEDAKGIGVRNGAFGSLDQSSISKPVNAAAGDSEDIIWYADLDSDGTDEQIVLYSPKRLDSEGYTEFAVVDEDGSVMYEDSLATAHAGWRTIALTASAGREYLLDYRPEMFQGDASYSYRLLGIRNGQMTVLEEYSVDFTINDRQSENDVQAMKSFRDKANEIWSQSLLLFSTDQDVLLSLVDDADGMGLQPGGLYYISSGDLAVSYRESMYGLMDASMDLVPETVDVPGVKLSSALVWPCDSTIISSPFGERVQPVTGTSSFHDHVDIAAEKGSSVYAAFAGTVKTAEYDPARGYYILLQHSGAEDQAETVETIYMHLSELNAAEGDVVKAGDVIGTVGATGMATGPHLAFGVYVDGEAVDPLSFYR